MPGLVEMFADLYSQVASLTAAMGRHERVPEQRWATVTICTVSRIGVKYPGETVEQVIDRSTEAVWVGAQVLVQVQGTARWIVGLAGATIPAGIEAMFGGPTVPDGWLLRDGSLLSRAIYWRLFAAIGVTWGAGDGSTTFRLPDARGRVDVGTGTATGAAGATAHTLGQEGGEETHALTAAENGPHTHPPLVGANYVNGYVSVTGIAAGSDKSAGDAGAANATTGSSGSGTAHNNLPPYVVGTPIIKF